MTTTERLLKIDEGIEKTQALNAELEATLNGDDTGYKSYYHEFWDSYQQNGERKSYAFAFAGEGWTVENFKPKYDIIVKTTARSMFSVGLAGVDVEQLLIDLGITFDTSGVTSIDGFEYFCQYASPSVLPVISTISTSRLRYVFYHASNLVTIRKFILKDDGSQTFTSLFPNCSRLENLIIEGTIGQNGFDISGSPKLSKASITSIINALSTTTSGLTVTLSQTAVNNAFTTDEWNTLIATKSNWTISLA